MAYGRKVEFEAVREAAFGAIGAGYAALGTALADHGRVIGFFNSTNEGIYVSFDGVVDHLRLAARSFQLFDLTANKVRDDGYFLPVRTQVYIKRVSGAPTSGAFWAQVMVAAGGI